MSLEDVEKCGVEVDQSSGSLTSAKEEKDLSYILLPSLLHADRSPCRECYFSDELSQGKLRKQRKLWRCSVRPEHASDAANLRLTSPQLCHVRQEYEEVSCIRGCFPWLVRSIAST